MNARQGQLDPAALDPQRAITCRGCQHVLASEADLCPLPDGRARASFTNPMGEVFELVAVQDAPGAVAATPPTTEATWFPGCLWQGSLCRGCGTHVGWHYSGAHHFVGLIIDRVVLP